LLRKVSCANARTGKVPMPRTLAGGGIALKAKPRSGTRRDIRFLINLTIASSFPVGRLWPVLQGEFRDLA
jgi:hypothetical protein